MHQRSYAALNTFAFLAVLAWSQAPGLDYDQSIPFEERVASKEMRPGGVTIKDISFRNLAGGRTSAYLVLPPGKEKHAAALFVHWYESEAKNSNRTQFLEEAVELGKSGLASLLVETPWSDPQWYPKRDVSKDYENSVAEVKELRRALKLLLENSGVHADPARIALIGHDFGAMYGILAAAADSRVKVVALQAFAPSFSDWFLYNQKSLSAQGKQAVIARLAPLDPVAYLPRLGKAPVLVQFAKEDFYVPREKAEQLYAAVTGPKKILWYDSGHGLNPQASADRIAWLKDALKLK